MLISRVFTQQVPSKAAAVAVLVLGLVGSGCCTKVKVGELPAAPPTNVVTKDGVEVRAAVHADGSSGSVEVTDWYPSPNNGDGVNEIVIDSSSANASPRAAIVFPAAEFGDGPREVTVTAMHFNSCRLEAFDKNGNAVAAADHTAGQTNLQSLKLVGANISRIEIIGAEVGIREICWKR